MDLQVGGFMYQLRIRLIYSLLTKKDEVELRAKLGNGAELFDDIYISTTFPYHQLLQSDISRQKLFLTFNVLLSYIPTGEVKRCITAVLYCTLTFRSVLQIFCVFEGRGRILDNPFIRDLLVLSNAAQVTFSVCLC